MGINTHQIDTKFKNVFHFKTLSIKMTKLEFIAEVKTKDPM